ncbi:hypothetical protein QYF36_014953 [Acer negundo]|nr:hypothetical protein QYF36_014953 [Acer negundo]
MEKAELIFVPSPGIGHLVATLEFAKRLIDCDDRILITVLVMKLPFTTFVDAYTKSFTASQSRIQLIDLPEVEPPSSELRNGSIEYITLCIDSQLPHVRNIVSDIVSSRSSSESVRVTGLVVDFFCVSMIDVASEVCLPSYIFLTSNAGFLGLMLYLPTRHDQISTVFEPSDSELSISGFVNPVPVSVLPLGLFHKLGYSSYIKLAQRFNDVNGIIVNIFSELEPYAVNSFSGNSLNPPLYTVGTVLELKGQPNPDLDGDRCQKILKWLDDQPESSVAFLCFGSKGSFGPAQVKEIVLSNLNAFQMVKELGLAVEIRLDSKDGDLVMAEEIARAVRCVMDGNSEVRKKVKEMSEISRKSLMDGGSSFISIRKFIDLNF